MMIRINLIPSEAKVQIPRAYKHITLGVVVLLLGLGCMGYVWTQTNAIYNDRKAEAAKKDKIAKELDAVIKEVNRFKKTKADLEEKLDTIQRLKDSQKGPLRLLTEMRDRFPKQVWVSSISYRKGVVNMKGFGLTLTTVGELVENLKTCKYFGEINYQKSQSVSNRGFKSFNFDISFPFDPDPEKTKADAEKKAQAEAEKRKAKEARDAQLKKGKDKEANAAKSDESS